jgi:hypothetical protein
MGLLVAANCLRAALSDEEAEAVHASLCLARNAVVRRNCAIGAPSGTGQQAFRAGARQLLRAVDELLLAIPVSGGQCDCVTQARPVADQLIALAQVGGEVSSKSPVVGVVLRSMYESQADERR